MNGGQNNILLSHNRAAKQAGVAVISLMLQGLRQFLSWKSLQEKLRLFLSTTGNVTWGKCAWRGCGIVGTVTFVFRGHSRSQIVINFFTKTRFLTSLCLLKWPLRSDFNSSAYPLQGEMLSILFYKLFSMEASFWSNGTFLILGTKTTPIHMHERFGDWLSASTMVVTSSDAGIIGDLIHPYNFLEGGVRKTSSWRDQGVRSHSLRCPQGPKVSTCQIWASSVEQYNYIQNPSYSNSLPPPPNKTFSK